MFLCSPELQVVMADIMFDLTLVKLVVRYQQANS